MLDRFIFFMGAARLRALFLWLATTGLASLILNVVVEEYDWARPAQTLLALAAIIGAAVIIVTRLEPDERRRWFAILAPALGAVVLAFTVATQFALPLLGGAVGWIVTGLLLFRSKTPTEMRLAVRALRKSDYAGAVKYIDELIHDEPANPNLYRFRAEVLRVWGKTDRARRDYLKMTELEPESAVAFNGLAEVYLQTGDHAKALTAAQRAAELAPDEWVALYNLGMIEDRLARSADARDHLERALALRVRDARHRLLMHLYRARAHARLGERDLALRAIADLRRERTGLDEWRKLIASDQAHTLRAVLGDDIALAERLLDEPDTADAWIAAQHSPAMPGTPAVQPAGKVPRA
jgi:tetratricopeptide (TPR) repeat protein